MHITYEYIQNKGSLIQQPVLGKYRMRSVLTKLKLKVTFELISDESSSSRKSRWKKKTNKAKTNL